MSSRRALLKPEEIRVVEGKHPRGSGEDCWCSSWVKPALAFAMSVSEGEAGATVVLVGGIIVKLRREWAWRISIHVRVELRGRVFSVLALID